MSVDNRIREALFGNLSASDTERAVEFLEQGFSFNGQVVIASVFLFAVKGSKGIDEVLEALTAEWERSWKFQHPDIRADADAPAAAGIQNRASLANVYSALGLQNPAEAG